MTSERLAQLLESIAHLRVAVVGDFCLDRYLEIDPEHQEISIETGLPVYKVERVRAQPGAAGTVLNNLVALGVGELYPVGFCGEDGEGYELERALRALRGVSLEAFASTPLRRTFTYCKPLLVRAGTPPQELNRLDSKNWTPTPVALSERLADSVRALRGRLDAVVVMDQVDLPGSGVVVGSVLQALSELGAQVPVLADSRSGFASFPPLIFKMNRVELSRLAALQEDAPLEAVRAEMERMAQRHERAVFVTLAGEGMLGAEPGGPAAWVPSLPLRGPIDVVGAGDSVTAGLSAALASGANIREAMELAMLVASITVHQLGTTGTATPAQIRELHAAASPA